MSSHSHPVAPAAGGRVAESQPSAFVVSGQSAVIAGVVLALVFIGVFWNFFYTQVRYAYTAPQDWGHTLVIPAISAYFVYLSREKLAAMTFRPAMLGLVPLVLGLAVYMAANFGPPALQHHNVRGLGVGLALLGVLIYFFGWAALRYLWFPWMYWMMFGQTISERALSTVTERMQDWSAAGAAVVLAFFIETERTGNVLTVFRGDGTPCPLNVAEACSGMRMLVAFMAIGVALAYIGLPFWWQRGILVALGFPISLAVNILRVASLGVLSMWDSGFTAGNLHATVGLVWLIPAFLLFLGAMWLVRNVVTDVAAPVASPKSGSKEPRDAI
ncbi:MAG: exosortase/archaeosortase family protein [Phycisphaerae bacterium]|nr:exosortase/archaeosortase family protein [Phycisphaerae bacterium]